jgi:hemoglobin
MQKDIENRKDIELLVNSFYDKVKTDSVIGHYFTKVIPVNWEKHLPVMYDFWETVLFYTGTYTGNPMLKHMAIHEMSHFTKNHFLQWTYLFNQTVDELFKGPNADAIKERSQNISTVMQIKILKH